MTILGLSVMALIWLFCGIWSAGAFISMCNANMKPGNARKRRIVLFLVLYGCLSWLFMLVAATSYAKNNPEFRFALR